MTKPQIKRLLVIKKGTVTGTAWGIVDGDFLSIYDSYEYAKHSIKYKNYISDWNSYSRSKINPNVFIRPGWRRAFILINGKKDLKKLRILNLSKKAYSIVEYFRHKVFVRCGDWVDSKLNRIGNWAEFRYAGRRAISRFKRGAVFVTLLITLLVFFVISAVTFFLLFMALLPISLPIVLLSRYHIKVRDLS